MFGFWSFARNLLSESQASLQEDNISKILSAANVKVEPYWPSLFAKLFAKNGIGSLIANVGAGLAVLRLHRLTRELSSPATHVTSVGQVVVEVQQLQQPPLLLAVVLQLLQLQRRRRKRRRPSLRKMRSILPHLQQLIYSCKACSMHLPFEPAICMQ